MKAQETHPTLKAKVSELFWLKPKECRSFRYFDTDIILYVSIPFQIRGFQFRYFFNILILSTAKSIWDSSIFYSIKPKLDIRLFVDFCVFTCFYQFLHDVIIKLFCRSKQFYDQIMQKLVKTGKNTEKTNNPISSSGSIE